MRIIALDNAILEATRRIFFAALPPEPDAILVYKVGNIGDIVCAIPSLIAIRRRYPKARITLLTSPGRRGMPGADEILRGAWYLDELRVYYADDIGSFRKLRGFIRNLRRGSYDLFIQIPDDLAGFRTLFRNILFAKATGARSAIGFVVRTIPLFKKTQVDFSWNDTEVESLLGLLKERGISSGRVEFDFPISAAQKARVKEFVGAYWGNLRNGEVVVAMNPGGKRETNRWPLERFRELAHRLVSAHNARIIVLGGSTDRAMGERIGDGLDSGHFLNACGELALLETAELLRSVSLLVSNSTGTIHIAAAMGVPCVGLYGVRDVSKRWWPYGARHKVLLHKFLPCNYRDEACIKRSIDAIGRDEAFAACDAILELIVKEQGR